MRHEHFFKTQKYTKLLMMDGCAEALFMLMNI